MSQQMDNLKPLGDQIWSDALLSAIDTFGEHLAILREQVASSDADGMEATFTRAKTARDEFAAILAQRQRGH